MNKPVIKNMFGNAIGKNKQTTSPLVSVVVPIYNVEKYLEKCFASIISQTYKNIEIFLINDGSTDESGKIADKLARNDLRVIVIHKKNAGLSDTRNVGIKIANGQFITFLDSDDCIDSDFIEISLGFALETGADIVQCNNTRKLSRLGTGTNRSIVINGKDAFIKLLKYKTIAPTAWAKLYKLSLFNNNNLLFPVGRLHEDTAILYKLVYLANKIVCFDRVFYYYRINDSSIMNASYTKSHYQSVMQYHEELECFITNHNVQISNATIYRHKALRILSILNKMALNQTDGSDIYKTFRSDYIALSKKSYSVVCILGIVPSFVPIVFRFIRSATPTIRKLMGNA